MKAFRLFFPQGAPSEKELAGSRRRYLLENAAASAIFSLGTGNFLAGYLSWMGAEPSFCALMGAIPQLGCVLQLVSPFLFERLRYRKLSIWLCCCLFRFSLGLAGFLPLLLHPSAKLVGMAGVYLIAFLSAGFVTPGLNQWMLELAPRQGRGRFFARRDILSALFNAGVTFFMGWQLDRQIAANQPLAGYLTVFGVLTLLALADALLLCSLREIPSVQTMRPHLRDFIAPLRSRAFRPVVLYLIFWFIALNLSSSFLPVYQITGLGMSHKLITGMNVAASAVGIGGSLLWGKLADQKGWKTVLLFGAAFTSAGYIGWFAVSPGIAPYVGPVLQCLTVCGAGAFGMANLNLQYGLCPSSGKTVYLGVASALSNVAGYGAVLLGAWTQPLLTVWMGSRSIPVLFLASALGLFFCLLYGLKKLK